jgi:hypothetical protein
VADAKTDFPAKWKAVQKTFWALWKPPNTKQKRSRLKAFGGFILATGALAVAAYSVVPESARSYLAHKLGIQTNPYTFPAPSETHLERDAKYWTAESWKFSRNVSVHNENYREIPIGGKLIYSVPREQSLKDYSAEFLLTTTGNEESASWVVRTNSKGESGYLFRFTYPTPSSQARYEAFRLNNGRPQFPAVCSESEENLYGPPIPADHLLLITLTVQGSSVTTTFLLHKNLKIFPCPGKEQRNNCEPPPNGPDFLKWVASRHPKIGSPIDTQCSLPDRLPGEGTFGVLAEAQRSPIRLRGMRVRDVAKSTNANESGN